MIEFVTAFFYGSLSVTHPCAITTLIATLVVLQRAERRGVPLFFLGFVTALLALGSLLQWGFASSSGKLMVDMADVMLGPLLILIGMSFSGLLSWKGISPAKMPLGNLGLGALMGLQLCPSSSLFFVGVFLPLSISSDSPLILLGLYVLGATSLVSFLHWGLSRGLRWWSTLEDSPYWGKGLGFLLITLGVYFSFRKGLF